MRQVNSGIDMSLYARIARRGLVAIVLFIMATAGLRPVVPALASCGGTTLVGNTTQLNAAIDTFNAASADCDFTIEFANDIILTSNLAELYNEDASLSIDGAGYTLDGDWDYITLYIGKARDVVIQDITITRSTISGIVGRHSNMLLSGVTMIENNSAGIVFDNAALTIVDSSFINNFGSGVEVYGDGPETTLTIVNSTFAGNNNDGITVLAGTATLTHVTSARNYRALYSVSSNVTVNNSILTESYDVDCYQDSDSAIDINYSLVGSAQDCDVDPGDGNKYAEDALLGLLGNYGGTTPTIPLLSLTGSVTKSSPAIDAGSDALSLDENSVTLDFDQRGQARNQGAAVDMGAFEGSVEYQCSASMSVGDENELAAAILCFNNAVAGDFTIEFENDITLTSDTIPINNISEDVSLKIDGAGYSLDGADIFRTLEIYSTYDVTIDRLTITRSWDNGIYSTGSNLRLSRSTIQRNLSDGIDFSDGQLTVIGSSVLYNDSYGLDLYYYDVLASANIINSTFYGNSNDGLTFWQTTATLTHVTSAGNSGGLYMQNSDVTVNNSILAGNEGSGCVAWESNISINYSLVAPDNDCNAAPEDGNILDVDPLLGPLGNYGGPTPTLPLVSLSGSTTMTSPAVDSGSDDLSRDEEGETLLNDQRGQDRKVGDAVDMGAFEGMVEIDCTFPMMAADEVQYNAAIYCFNVMTVAGVYTIELEDDIDLTGPPSVIYNTTDGVSLLIEGNDNAIDGQGFEGVRPITVDEETTVTLRSMTVTGGYMLDDGGGIENWGTLTLDDVRVEYNTSDDDGAGIYTVEGSITTIINSSISNNLGFDSGDGGGIANQGFMTITDSTISDNQVSSDEGGYGGGIYNEGNLTIVRSVIANNSIDMDFGYGYGGGIFNEASLTIRDSSIYDNSVTSGYGYIFGGGVTSIADSEDMEEGYGANLLIFNSTISGNTLSSIEGVFGGGIYASGLHNGDYNDPIRVELINTTVANNSIEAEYDFEGAGLFFGMGYTDFDNELEVTIHNSILAGNRVNGDIGGDCYWYDDEELTTLQSRSSLYQATGTDACDVVNNSNGNIVGANPLLGALGNNGGPTPTHLPGEGSPAIDAGNGTLAVDEEGDALTTDQRGLARISGSAVDMGSVEVGAAPAAAAVFMSATKSGNAGGVAYDNSDILMWDGEDWSKVFDGSAAGLFPENKPKHNTAAFWISGVGQEVIMSFAQNGRKVGDLPGKIDGMDLVRWDGSAFSLYFDGSDVGLTQKTPEKIDGLHVLPGSAAPDDFGGGCVAWLLISTQGPAKVPAEGGGQLKVGGEDVLGFCATNLGEDTAGFWRLVVDGSAVGLKKNAVDSLSVSDDGETIYMTMKKAVSSPLVAGHSTIIAYDMNSETFDGPLFKAADYSLTQKVDGLQVVGEIEGEN